MFVRSAHESANPWFQRALASGLGRIRAGGVVRDVGFDVPEPEVADAASAAYRAKYDRYGPSIVGTVVSVDAVATTCRVTPAGADRDEGCARDRQANPGEANRSNRKGVDSGH